MCTPSLALSVEAQRIHVGIVRESTQTYFASIPPIVFSSNFASRVVTIAAICFNRGIDFLLRGVNRAFAISNVPAVVKLFVVNGYIWRRCLRQSLIKQNEVCRVIPLCCRRLRNLCRSVIILLFKCTRVLYDVHCSRCSHMHKGHISWHQRAFQSRPLRRNSPTVTHRYTSSISIVLACIRNFDSASSWSLQAQAVVGLTPATSE